MFKLKGISDDITDCQKCGKTRLKCTVALESDLSGIVYYGRDCAALALRGSKKAADRAAIERQARAVSLATKLMNAGIEPSAVAQTVWNRFGFLTEARHNTVTIQLEKVDPLNPRAGRVSL